MKLLEKEKTKISPQHKENNSKEQDVKWRRFNIMSNKIIIIPYILILVALMITSVATKNKAAALDAATSNSQKENSEMNSPGSSSDASPSSSESSESGEEEITNNYTQLYPELTVEKSEFIEHVDGDKVIYLTFDDGPCDSTIRLLDVLDQLGVKATFFVTAQFGSDEELIPIMKEIYDRGHTLGVHSYTHKYETIYSSVENFLADYKMMDDLILEATGERSKIFRFPGGSNTVKNESIRNELIAEMERRGFIYHDWNANNGDSEGLGKAQQIERAVSGSTIREKSVVLMHNMPKKDEVIETLPEIVAQLRAQGYRFDVLDETVKPIQFS